MSWLVLWWRWRSYQKQCILDYRWSRPLNSTRRFNSRHRLCRWLAMVSAATGAMALVIVDLVRDYGLGIPSRRETIPNGIIQTAFDN